jgi:hypothetical protein
MVSSEGVQTSIRKGILSASLGTVQVIEIGLVEIEGMSITNPGVTCTKQPDAERTKGRC